MSETVPRKITLVDEIASRIWDEDRRFIATEPVEHKLIHEGKIFFVGAFYPDVDPATNTASGASVAVFTSGVFVHMSVDWGTSTGSSLEIWENPVITGGTGSDNELPTYNVNRGSVGLPVSVYYSGVSYYDLSKSGTQIGVGIYTGGEKFSGGTARGETEWVFKPDTWYLIRVNPDSATTKIGIRLRFYELRD